MGFYEIVQNVCELSYRLQDESERMSNANPSNGKFDPERFSFVPSSTEIELKCFLVNLTDVTFYLLLAIMYAGRLDFKIRTCNGLIDQVRGMAALFPNRELAAEHMISKGTQHEYIINGMNQCSDQNIQLDSVLEIRL